jgi:hypothetical protein
MIRKVSTALSVVVLAAILTGGSALSEAGVAGKSVPGMTPGDGVSFFEWMLPGSPASTGGTRELPFGSTMTLQAVGFPILPPTRVNRLP